MNIRIGRLRTCTLISLLSLFGFAAHAGAQGYNFKQLGRSPKVPDKTAEAPTANVDNPLYPWIEDTLYNLCMGATAPMPCYGWRSQAGLIQDSQGNLYGTTVGQLGDDEQYYCTWVGNPGENGDPGSAPRSPVAEGTVFEFDLTFSQAVVLHRFESETGDGANPVASLMFDTYGNLWGTTCTGGQYNLGTVFQLHQAGGVWSETFLYSFGSGGTGDGANPVAGLVEDANGNLYGTTLNGGVFGGGTVFELSLQGNAWTETPIYNFSSYDGDGSFPAAGLIISDLTGAVTLYGTTAGGGNFNCPTNVFTWSPGCGTVFEIWQVPFGNWFDTVLWAFQGGPGDGANPVAGLTSNGGNSNGPNLYGTTENGGFNCEIAYYWGCGTVFQLQPPVNEGTPWGETVLYNFCPDIGSQCPDGANPVAGLTLDVSGNGLIYGTTLQGGVPGITCLGSYFGVGTGCGTVFELYPMDGVWVESPLYTFDATYAQEYLATPGAGLIQNAYRTLYGTTLNGGPQGEGSVYALLDGFTAVVLKPAELKWGAVAVGKIGPAKSVKLTNTGTATLDISGIEISGDFALVQTEKDPCGITVAAGATCLIAATFDPTQTGQLTGAITITDNAKNSPQTVSLSGTGIQ
ncbi:MAG TPA: choice-of-anchor tandem repeat GloVer-containing protein [Terriglobales bacterium]|jgi:uncharacterized repeat protein (TIGR03803 family)|nr:choice-of-anchor tandem repeat GloVer-containing protein [Terriglobales bacterium]